MSTPFEVPAVDISAYQDDARAADRRSVAQALDSACRTVGFVQITGHGIPSAVIDGLTAAMDGFFGQELEVKKAYRTPPEVNRGYSPPKSESLSLSLGVEQASRMNDFFEAFNVGAGASKFPGAGLEGDPNYAENVWPASTPEFDGDEFTSRVEAYFEQAQRVARLLTWIFADALGVERCVFTDVATHSIDVLRMNNYALPEGTVDLDGDLIGMGEHTDYGIVTVLWADQVAGLQVLGHDGAWHDVQPADDALLINLGDLTARWTDDAWMSTLHRVKPPVIDGRIRRRRSAAFFHDGNVDAVISTIPSCAGAGGATYPPITVGEHLAAKLGGSRAGVPNGQAGSEAGRVLSAQG